MGALEILSLLALGLKVVPPMVEQSLRLIESTKRRFSEGSRPMTEEEQNEIVAYQHELAQRAAATAPPADA